jgi:hypothetical protein
VNGLLYNLRLNITSFHDEMDLAELKMFLLLYFVNINATLIMRFFSEN